MARVAALIAVFASGAEVGAAPPELTAASPLENYTLRTWGLEDGLPQNSVVGLVQAEDGYLWLATFGGLARFDGARFEVFDPTNGLAEPRVVAVARGRQGALWLGFEEGGLARRIADRFEAVPGTRSLAGETVQALHPTAKGLWIGTTDRVLFLEQDRLTVAHGEGAFALQSDGGDGVYASAESGMNRLRPGRRAVPLPDVRRILVESDDRQWLLTSHGLQLRAGTGARTIFATSEQHWLVAGPIVGPRGALWFSIGPRVYRLKSRPALLARPDTPVTLEDIRVLEVPSPVRQLLADREQNLWLGTDGSGLIRVTEQPFDDLSRRYSMEPGAAVAVLAAPDGGLFVAQGGRVLHLRPDRPPVVLADGEAAGALALGPRGELWIGGRALTRVIDGKAEEVVSPRPDFEITALAMLRGGQLYFGTHDGLFTYDGASVAPVMTTDSRVSTLVEGPDETLWVGLHSQVLAIRRGRLLSSLGEKDGVPAGPVRAILPLEGGELWLGSYGGGLSWIRGGEVHRFARRDGLFDNFISSIVDDRRGNLWMNSNRGVFRVPRTALEQFVDGALPSIRAYPLPTGEGMGASPAQAFDPARGRLTFTTIRGLVEIDLDQTTPNTTPPVTILEQANVDGVPLVPGQTTRVPPGAGQLDASFTAALLRRPDLAVFEYQLRGVETGWERVGLSRRAHYENLGPGHYTFTVRTINEDGVTGPTVEAAFRIESHLTETIEFRGGLALLLLVLAWAGHRLRTRSIERRNQELHREVAQRRLAEAAVGEREAHYRRVFEASANGFFVTGADERITDVNPAACQMLQATRADLLGRTLFDALGWPQIPAKNATAPDGPSQAPKPGELVLCRRADGSEFEGRVSTHPFLDSNESAKLTVVTDVSELLHAQAQEHRLREQLLHSQRVEAIGVLAGGVAHDVNNMLTAVHGYAELAKTIIEDGGDLREAADCIDEVLRGATRTSKVTKQLLTYGRRQSADPSGMDLSTVVANLQPLLERASDADIQLDFQLASDLAPIQADQTQIEQVVMNLVINAIGAMPDGGRIEIRTEMLDTDTVQTRYPDLGLTEKQVCLRVQDQGIGMAEDVKARIFDPFFTTKDIGEGTGLGLSGVLGIVTKAKGHIMVASRPGEGSCFDVLLPITEVAIPAKSISGTFSQGGGETILYVEDDDSVRPATEKMLAHAGYRVLTCSGPGEALARYGPGIASPQLMLTDMVMPGMNGRELGRQMALAHPGLKVLYVSGYLPDGLDALDHTRERFLAKPYGRKGLLRTVRQVLDQAMASVG